jgi:mono/diheme cytochrome c family protein
MKDDLLMRRAGRRPAARSPFRIVVVVAFLSACGCGAKAPAPAPAADPKTGKLVVVKDEKAYFEQADGTVVGVPLSQLTPLERQGILSMAEKAPEAPPAAVPEQPAEPAPPKPFVDKPVFVEVAPERPPAAAVPAATDTPAPASAAPASEVIATEESVGLIHNVQKILQAKCHRCHGDGGTNEGGFNYVMNLAKLKEAYVVAGAPERSRLFQRISDTNSDAVMPPAGEEPRLAPAEMDVLRKWIATGAASPKGELRRFIRNEEIIKRILDDLALVPERTRRFHRYVTLTNLYNSGATADEMATYRLAFVKLVNSLSWNATLFTPPAVDPEQTILRIDLRALNWSDDNWEQIVKANPYGIPVDTPEAQKCTEETQTTMPVVRVDWFVFAASKPPLYHSILGIPETDDELENLLRINVSSNIDQEKVVRAGFNRSGISRNNRMIERHESPYGSYWKSYDFSGNTGKQNLFAYPLGPDGKNAFVHAGGEIIFTLPNGLLGFMLTDHAGRRIDKGPTEIVSDLQRPDRAVVNGISCLSCHYGGPIPKADEVRDVVMANRKAFDESDRILAMYAGTEAVSRLVEQDARKFTAALEKLEIRRVSKAGEPISSMSMRFEGELDCRMAAAELGLTASELSERLPATPTVGRTIGALNLKGGMVKRDTFVEVFRQALDELGLRGRSGSAKGLAASKPVPGKPRVNRGRMAKITVKDENAVGEIRRFPPATWLLGALTFSPDGGWLAVGTQDQKIMILDVDKQKQIELLEKVDAIGRISAIAFSPAGDALVAGGDKGVIGVYKLDARGQLTPRGILNGHTRAVAALAFSPDGRRVVSGGADNTLRGWDAKSFKQEFAVDFERDPKACVVSDDGRSVFASDGKTFRKIELLTGKVENTVTMNHRGFGQFVTVHPDGKQVVLNSGFNLTIFDTEGGGAIGEIGAGAGGQHETFWSGVFSPDGGRFLAGGMSGVSVWDMTTKERVASYSAGATAFIKLIAYSPDGLHAAAVGDHDRTIVVYRLPKK